MLQFVDGHEIIFWQFQKQAAHVLYHNLKPAVLDLDFFPCY